MFKFIVFYYLLKLCGGEVQDVYDFVIIGAGSGGSVVANRLSENPNWKILLLEAGRDENFLTDIPLLAAIQTITSYNWGYKSEKLKTACQGLVKERCNMPRGKALGGTSVINFLLYTRGNKLDYDEWAELGNYGWSYNEILPYFIKSENCSLCSGIDENVHGRDGYLNIEHPRYKSPLVDLFLKTGEDLGYKIVDPVHGLGFSRVLATMKNGARCSAYKAFLSSVDRPNLRISKNSRVTRILINNITKEAEGVEFLNSRKRYVVRAKREVILSAGSLNSPQLLMLSGVGPKQHLDKHKIPVVKNLNGVGYNLQDHMALSTLSFLVNESVTVSDLRLQNPRDILNYVVFRRGPYTIPGGAEALGFIQTKYGTKTNYPDIELVLGAGALNGDVYGSLRSLLGIPDSLFSKIYAPDIGIPAFGIATVLMRPKSTGRVQLKDSNPLHWPILEPNYFQRDEDVAVMVEGIKTAISIANSPRFKRFSPRLNERPIPGCEEIPFGTDSYWGCVVRQISTTLGHQVGTCKMGPPTDPYAVVDPELRVYGIKRLRVVDGSIMPNIIAGHTNAAIIMIGEKAADIIKGALCEQLYKSAAGDSNESTQTRLLFIDEMNFLKSPIDIVLFKTL